MRTQQTTVLPPHLKALNLFGFGQAQETVERPDILAPVYAVRAICPTITEAAFPLTMQNYRAYISEYNIATGFENIDIENHNAEVSFFLQSDRALDLHKTYAGYFPKLNQELNDRDYNLKADEINQQHGPIIAKRVIQEIKYPTEQVFQNLLHLYNTQLIKRNQVFKRHTLKVTTPIQPLEINSYLVTKLKRNDVTSLPVCSKTVRNHRLRLEEAGVLLDYSFHGRQKGVKAYINPQILVVFDTKTARQIGSENQTFSIWKGKSLPDINEITRAYKEEYKEKDDATQSSVDKVSAMPTFSFAYKTIFYGNTGGNEGISPVGAAPETVKVEKTLSEKLRDLILHPQELAESLAAKEYDNYTPIPIRDLSKVVYEGTLTNAEFKELVIQDLLKQSAKMWREKTPYAGNWKKTINRWMQTMFISHLKDPEGNYHPLGKEAVLNRITELRYRLDHAHKWFLSKKINPLYPYDYFDPSRKTSKELGFEHTKKNWARRVKYLENLPAAQVKEKQKAAKRIARVNHSKKFDTAINQFLKNKTTLLQLEEYVINNLPANYHNDLPKELKNRMAAAALKNNPFKI